MTYSVGNSSPANYANTSSGKVTNVVADNGVGGSGESVNVVDRATISLTIGSGTFASFPNLSVIVSTLPNYIPGKSDITITVSTNAYVYSTGYYTPNPGSSSFPYPAMSILGGQTGDTITLVNNGYILGRGGNGSYPDYGIYCCGSFQYWVFTDAKPGQPALFITYNTKIINTGIIGGGGGGGGGQMNIGNDGFGGAGGAGGGLSSFGQAAAVPGQKGQDAPYPTYGSGPRQVFGGGGGLIAPGVQNAAQTVGSNISTRTVGGYGGGAGGDGSFQNVSGLTVTTTNFGGIAGNAAPYPNVYDGRIQGGGGGGYGADGGNSYLFTTAYDNGQPGGPWLVSNGKTHPTTNTGSLFGTINDASVPTVVYTIPTGTYQGLTISVNSIPGIVNNCNLIIVVTENSILYGPGLPSDYQNLGGLILRPGGSIQLNTIKIIVNGTIYGVGGNGGTGPYSATNGGPAILNTINCNNLIIDATNGYVLGGGGGGGESYNNGAYNIATKRIYGGGGSGGGNSGYLGVTPAYGAGAPTSGSTSGSNGNIVTVSGITYIAGGGGGRNISSTDVSLGTKTTGQYYGLGGSGGGSGSAVVTDASFDLQNKGAGGYNPGGTDFYCPNSNISAGGGGGWGAQGGFGTDSSGIIGDSGVGGPLIYNLGTVIIPTVYIINYANTAGVIN